MSHEILGLVLLGCMFVVILGGFPISFTLFLLGIVFGYIALQERVFHLMTYQIFDTMNDTVLAAVALFTFMGYVLESAGLMNRLFHAVQLLFGRTHGALFLATILTATLFAAATGIVGASVTIIALMAAPVMMRSGYDQRLCGGNQGVYNYYAFHGFNLGSQAPAVSTIGGQPYFVWNFSPGGLW